MSICERNRQGRLFPGPARLFITALALALAGGGACSKDDHVAELGEKAGTVDLSRAKTWETWSGANVGAKFKIGDGVRTAVSATAAVKLTNGASLKLAEKTTIRFAVVPGKKNGFRLEVLAGSAQLIVGDKRLVFDTNVGQAVLEGGTTVELTAGANSLKFAVLVGKAQLDAGDGLRTVSAGEELIISMKMGRAIIQDEPDAAIPDAAPPDAAPPPSVLSAVVKGRKVKAQKPGSDEWETLKAGPVELELGTRLKLPRRSSVKITSGDESALIRGRGEVVVGTEDALVDASAGGSLSVEALSQELTTRVPGGLVTAKARRGGSAGTLGINARNGKTNLAVGKGNLEVDNGKEKTLLKIGEKAVLEKNGLLTITNRAPTVSDITIRAGETAVLHDRRGRTAVRINFAGSCPAEGRVEMTNKRGARAMNKSVAEGAGSAKVWAERGGNAYRVLCLVSGVPKKTAARGRLIVRRDSGQQRLPRKATRNTVESDGRRYKVLYQNLLPVLTFKWRKPPQATSFTLKVRNSKGEVRTAIAKSAEHTFKAGALPEEEYQFWFEPAGSNRSKTSKLSIRFDNAAPTAYIRSPAHGARWAGGKVKVAGVALKGWKVAIGRTRVPLDRQFRFDTTVVAPQNDQAIAIRLSHPRRGTHYYLRRRGR